MRFEPASCVDPRTERLLAARASDPAAGLTGWRRMWRTSALRIWIDAHRLLAAAAAAACLSVGVAIYYTFVVLPVRRADALAQAEQLAGQQKAADDLAGAEGLDACLATALGAHRVVWDQTCREAGKADCTLPRARAVPLDERHREARAACLKQFSIR